MAGGETGVNHESNRGHFRSDWVPKTSNIRATGESGHGASGANTPQVDHEGRVSWWRAVCVVPV